MAFDILNDVTTAALAKCLDISGLRHRVISDNIANAETPGFIRSEVIFEEKLKEALQAGDRSAVLRRLDDMRVEITQDLSSPSRPDGNNVSIDKEMANLATNTLQYETLVQLLNLKGAMLRAAITEGRR